jgi:hypothetical protein
MRNTRHHVPSNRPERAVAVGRKPLTVPEILELEAALMEVFVTIRELRERSTAARYIKFPPLPSILSESIAIAITPTLFGADWKARYGGSAADVLIENLATRSLLRVEVKATGRHAFQELKEKDLRADVLIWFRFGRRLELGAGEIEVAIIESPGRYVPRQCRLDVRRFEAIAGIREAQKLFRFKSLAAMLAPLATGVRGTPIKLGNVAG